MARWSLPILAAVSLASCRTPESLCVAPSALNRLTVTAEPGMNGGLATEIDLVFVTSRKAFETIGKMKARDYFAQREQMVRDFPTGLRIRSFGLEPAQRQVAYKTEPPCNLVGALLFVNYDNDRPNRVRLGNAKAGTLALGADDFTWHPGAGAAPAANDAPAQYEKLREAFHVALAGRFPFGSDRAASADPGEVRSFFETYGRSLAPLRARLEAERPGSEAAAVLGQLQRAQTALAPMLAGPGPLAYSVDVAFFTDPTLAQGQRQIVEGRLGTTPSNEARTPHGPRSFGWTMGQPVRLSLRWALKAPSLPIESISDPAGECRPPAGGGTANVRVDDSWALLRLIARYRSPDAGDLDGSDAGIPLVFTIPVCANLQRAAGGDDRPGPARIFLRLSLSAKVRTPGKPDRLVPVALPDFPRSMPRLDGSDSLGSPGTVR